jgi:multiple sugar transport system substrate-binding protein
MKGTTPHSTADHQQITADPPLVKVSRRAFVRTTGRALAGLAGILAASRPPAARAARDLSILTPVNYAPASDEKFRELGQRFTKKTGINVRVDHIQSVQMPAKLSAELMSKAGHDIVGVEMYYPWLYRPALVDVSDITNDLAKKHGDWYPFLKAHAYVEGQWLAVPCMYISMIGSHRVDLFEKVGEKSPETWDDLLRAGRKLKKIGNPVGIAISQTTDSIAALYSLLWAYGAKDVAADGKTVAIRSKETEAAVDYMRALYTDAMEPDVLSWDNASNNQAFNAGKASWIHNPISHYIVARDKKMPVAQQTAFELPLAGSAGRHTTGAPRSLGIWKFSKNQEAAREFLHWFFEPAQYHEWIMSGDNYNCPVWRDMEHHAVWDADPKYKPLKQLAQYSHLYGWPAPPSEKIQLISNSYILPNMFAKAVTGMSTKDAIAWAETEMKKILAG